jgi:hypothetical protein
MEHQLNTVRCDYGVININVKKATNKFDMPLRKPIFKGQMITEG